MYGSPSAVAHSWTVVPASLLLPHPLMLCCRSKVALELRSSSTVPDLFARHSPMPDVKAESLCFAIDWSFLLPLTECVEVDPSAFPVGVEKTVTEQPLELQKPSPPLCSNWPGFVFISFCASRSPDHVPKCFRLDQQPACRSCDSWSSLDSKGYWYCEECKSLMQLQEGNQYRCLPKGII